jgi:hypothetical protein
MDTSRVYFLTQRHKKEIDGEFQYKFVKERTFYCEDSITETDRRQGAGDLEDKVH